jgi:DnaA-like protein
VEQPWCLSGEEWVGAHRYVERFGGAKPVGGSSPASLFKVYGARKRGGAPSGILRGVGPEDFGDKNFVEQIDEKIRSEREIELPGPRAKLSKLLRLTAQAYGVTEGELVRPGRQRRWVKPRSALVYLAWEWGRVSVKEIGRRLHRDPSIISRLYSAYAADRDPNKERLPAKQLEG